MYKQQPPPPPPDSPLPTPEATPPAVPLSPEAAAALTFIVEQQKVPPAQLVVTSEEAKSFPTLARNYVLVTLLYNQADALQTFRVLVDPTTKAVESDLDGLMVAEQAAYQAKYGKFDPPLYDKLQSSREDDQIPVVIWAAEVGEEDSVKAAETEVAQLYPEAAKALAERGVPWSVDDGKLRLEIKQKYAELLAARSTTRVQPIVEWLEAKGYKIEKIEGAPIVAATMTKYDILALAELPVVSQMNLGGGHELPSSNISVPTSRVPAVWSRGMSGNNVRLAIVEGGKINTTARNCLNIIATRDSTVADANHKSRVAAVAACNDQTLRGVAYTAQLLDAGYTLGADMATAAQALNWAVAQNFADVVNHSASFGTDTAPQYLDRYYDYMIRAYDFTAVIAAGNTTNSNNVSTPGKGWSVIAVGNVDDKNNAAWSDDDLYATSSYINPSTGIEKPEVAAPGTNINTVAGQETGTSFAAPHVAGLAALLMERKVALKDYPSAVNAIIMASAVHNTEGDKRLSDKDGAGGVDAALADWIAQTEGGAGACNTPCWWHIVTNDSNLPEPGNLYRYFNAIRGERIRVVISWLAAASADGVQDGLNTELNLHVQRPNGTVIQSSTSSVNGFEIVDFTADVTGQYAIRVERINLPAVNEADNALGIAWVKLATYLPDVRRNTADGWTSSFYVRNDDAEPRTAKVTFFNADGSYNTEASTTLNPDALWNPVPPNNWQGSALVDGSEDLSVVVAQERTGTYTHEAYAGVGNPAADVLVPIVQKNNSSWYSDLFIMNSGGTATNVTTQFLPAPGYGSTLSFAWSGISPGGSIVINTGSVAIGNSSGVFVGSVRITNSAGQPLAIASTQYKTTGSSQMLETSNTQLPATVLYGPLIQNNNAGWLSGLALSSYTTPPKFYVRYNPNGNAHCYQETPPPSPTPEPNPRIILPAPSGGSCPATPMALFQSDGAMTANVNQLQGVAGATTYAAVAMPSKTISIAKVRRDNGWSDGFTIANFSANAATVTVRIYNADGTENGSSPIYNQVLAAGQSAIMLGQIPLNFSGSAVVNATEPVAVSVNSWKSSVGTGDTIGSYPGNHR